VLLEYIPAFYIVENFGDLEYLIAGL